ncbi:RagB/SusD family nutrient uptake outer membrane protein [Pseudotamlana carrageenivorans]|uniref:RagB/SusD family nutrient uptake outer membrane protein n=1 Tax=Pseudotamlana carrageenivorans TaxID=2069432 RepID=A0A2I7SH29_9FLAO|nr:RagB/SusD family nutrient uptake outer membrane protein [Tamlana carrageenivorans]AUS05154.1 RagB/SusD family nutrient uptake outer membrane protein [Tamlana carrageenivorans]
MKKYINKTIQSLLTLSILLGATACGDAYLEDVDRYNIDSESYFNSEEDYYNALVGAYDLLQSSYVNVMLGEIASDNTLAGGGSAVDVPGFQQIDDMIHTPVNSNLRDIWTWMYAGVNRVNFILEFQDKTDFPGREIIIGEAYFLRAYYYFELVKWFGPVPLKQTRYELGDETTIPRSPVADVYKLIQDDLKYAVEHLEYTAPEVGRVTKGAALALLGKAYLYQKQYAEAALVLDRVINEGPYDLVADYDSIFENDGENGIESVFEVQYTDAEGAGFECLQCSEGNVAVGFNSIRTYDGPLFDSGFSFNVPTQEAVDAFEDGDLRKDVAILDIENWAATTGATYGTGYEHTGFFNRKYLARKGDLNTGDQNLTNPNNYRSIRFADVLLMAAEAYNSGGIDDTKAQTYLNRVRERAFGDSAHNVTSTGAALTDAIAHERRVELVGEGHRFFDLVRTGKAAQEIDGFTAGKNEVFPIPIEEIQFSNGNWEQNPNY